MSDTIVKNDNEVRTDISDPDMDGDDEVAHIVRREHANKGYIGQVVIEALCGYKWIPHKNPDNFPVCKKCIDAFKRYSRKDSN